MYIASHKSGTSKVGGIYTLHHVQSLLATNYNLCWQLATKCKYRGAKHQAELQGFIVAGKPFERVIC